VRRLCSDRRAATAVEFALVGLPLLAVSFGTLDLGLILWTKSALQAVAADAARCGAISGSACTGSNSITSFVQTEASQQALSAVVNSATYPLTVNVNSNASSSACPSITIGTYETVEITTSYLASGWLPPPFGNYTIDVCASYPT